MHGVARIGFQVKQDLSLLAITSQIPPNRLKTAIQDSPKKNNYKSQPPGVGVIATCMLLEEIVLLINLDAWAASVDRSNKAALPGTAP